MTRPWKVTTVQEFADKGEAELKTGPFGTQLHASDYVEQGTPVINVRNIGLGSVVPEKLEFLDTETVARLSGHLLQRKDIVFGRKGAVERHAFIRDEQHGWFQGSDCLRLRVRSSALNPRFLSYTLLTESHKQWMMNQCSHGATMASLNQAIICRIPLRLPDIGTQDRIADILSAYDDLIENNTRRIKMLEQMAEMLYREWFVHFRFPGHEKVRMVESELGMIPEQWEVVNVGKLLKFHIGGGWGEDMQDEVFPAHAYVIRGTDIPQARLGALDGCPLRYHKESNLASRKLAPFDIVFEVSGGSKGQPVGRALLVHPKILSSLDGDVMCASFCKLLRVDISQTGVNHFYQFLLDSYTNGQIEKYQVQSTGITNFKFAVFLEDAKVAIPPEDLRNRFEALSQPMMDGLFSLGRKNANLRTTRDLLLPKLVFGEVSVEQIEKEAVAKMV
jgi:type I restriction enzyme, S subunit